MIDFRYHLVSLASVLIALAIGIVLGAGPLKEGIGATLNEQVVQLRKEKTDLRTELDGAQRALGTHEAFETAQLQAVVAGRLNGRSVVVVTLPGSDSAIVTSVEDALTAAGATVTARVAVNDDWVDAGPSAVERRSTLAAQLRGPLGITTEAVEGGQDLDGVLAALLVAATPGSEDTPIPTTQQRTAAWELMTDAGLTSGDLPSTAANSAVVLGGPQVPAATPAEEASLTGFAALAAAIDREGDGAVLAAGLIESTSTSSSVISAARAEAAIRRQLSTVDDAQRAMGAASIVLALVEQFAGDSGQYGRLSGANAPFPGGG